MSQVNLKTKWNKYDVREQEIVNAADSAFIAHCEVVKLKHKRPQNAFEKLTLDIMRVELRRSISALVNDFPEILKIWKCLREYESC